MSDNPYVLMTGTTPGVLDPTQPRRLLRTTGSKLSFASFHPRTASADRELSHFGSLSLNEELCRPKRIVVETGCDGAFWRFVPHARREEGAQDEGTWPQFINICGQIAHCTQDQWDIYKLDPAYICVIRAQPQIPIIILNNTLQTEPPVSEGRKRHPSSSTPANRSPSAKKLRVTSPHGTCSEDSDEEVEDIMTNNDHSQRAPPGCVGDYKRQRSKIRAEMEEIRKVRRDKIKRENDSRLRALDEDQVMAEPRPTDAFDTLKTKSQSIPPPSTTKRKAWEHENHSSYGSYLSQDFGTQSDYPSNKRARTHSPRWEMMGKRVERGIQRARDRKQKREQLRRARDQAFEQELYANNNAAGPSSESELNEDSKKAENAEPEEVDPEELARQRIKESRLKIAELEKDRHIWEEEARKRRIREEAERNEKQAAKEALRKKVEAERLEKERRERAIAERERIKREEARKAKEKKQAQRKSQWAHGPWNVERALQRYRILSEQFDNAKFSPSDPLTFDDVPWPILAASFSVEDIDWSAVERFFESIRPHMRSQDYKAFVEKSHRRFHPDRWRARGILNSMRDDEQQQYLEVAANTVAQALTPIWRRFKQ